MKHNAEKGQANKAKQVKATTEFVGEGVPQDIGPMAETESPSDLKQGKKKVPKGWVIVSVEQNNVKVYDFLQKKDVDQTLKNIAKIEGDKPEMKVAFDEGAEYDPAIVGEKDPAKLAANGGVSVKELNAISGCTTC